MPPPTPLTVVYKEINSSKITTDIYLPPPSPAQNHPIIINLHGGAFMLGNSRMVSPTQIEDCLNRGWIVLVPNHRLCPQVDVLEGPITDIRDLLAWVYNGGLNSVLEGRGVKTDLVNVAAFGTSSGGTLALCLGFDVPKPVKAIYSLYGAVDFNNPLWKNPLPHLKAILPQDLTQEFINKVFTEFPVPTDGSISLEGQSDLPPPSSSGAPGGSGGKGGTGEGPPKPNFNKPRDAFAFTHMANGAMLDAIYPGNKDIKKIDPLLNISSSFPPTYIVHGLEDTLVPIEFSRSLLKELEKNGAECGMTEVPGEGHTFAAKMEVGSRTWELQREGFGFLEGVLRR